VAKAAPKERTYPAAVKALMAEKSRVLLQAQTLSEMGMDDLARPLWLSAAAREEEPAPQLELLEREREAAVHRVSAASCYERGGDPGRALNLYRAGLAGPLAEKDRKDLQRRIRGCLSALRRGGRARKPRRNLAAG
jgi:hypothetical protein